MESKHVLIPCLRTFIVNGIPIRVHAVAARPAAGGPELCISCEFPAHCDVEVAPVDPEEAGAWESLTEAMWGSQEVPEQDAPLRQSLWSRIRSFIRKAI